MKIYQLKTAKEFLDRWKDSNLSQEKLMQIYAKHVAERFAAECVNEALGNKMEVSNSLHMIIEKKYNSIWESNINLELVNGIEGDSIYINDKRICGENLCKDDAVINKWTISISQIEDALGIKFTGEQLDKLKQQEQ
jgi:hypothetical protein